MEFAKGGWTMDRPKYSDWLKWLAMREMERRRPYIKLPEEAMRGERFKSNDAVLARLESHYTEVEFGVCPGPAVEAMLIDAAKSDYWYEFEKGYGYDYAPEDEGDEEDD